MREIECDVAVIGAGTAGLAAFRAAREAGAEAVIVEKGPGGTTCARVGCMPSKLLIAAGDAAHAVREAGTFGVEADVSAIDGPAVMARVRRLRDDFVAATLADDGVPDDRLIRGAARFAGETTLLVGDDVRIAARAVVIATGSRPTVPEPLRALGDLVLTSDTVFEIPDLPESLAVIGAGPQGLELAQAFARLGVRVAVFDEGTAPGGIADPEVARVARDVLGARLDLHLGVSVAGERAGDGARLRWTGPDGDGTAAFARVLASAGRPPDLAGLDLAAAGLALDRHGTPVFDPETMRCGESAVFVAGDAAADRPVLHEAAFEGTLAGRNAARLPDVAPERRMVPLAIAYTDPEIASVGGGWAAVRESDPAIAQVDLSESGRARVMARNAGLIRLYAERRSGRFLGAELFGPEVEHLAHLLAWSVEAGFTVGRMARLPAYHPTLEEGVRAALRDLAEECGR